jgi:hypothetical protein
VYVGFAKACPDVADLSPSKPVTGAARIEGKAVSDELARWRGGLIGVVPGSRRCSLRGDILCREILESEGL